MPDTERAPQAAAERLCRLSQDARAAVVLDARGELAGASDGDSERAAALAEAARDLLEAVDTAAGEPPEQVEAHVEGGSVYVLRREGFALAAVTRRAALSSLMFYDARAVLDGFEADGR
jgi:hypothetical protein